MNTTAPNPTSSNSTTEKLSKNEKHQKKSRYFPTPEQIEKNDRLSIPKGTSVYCSTLGATIILPNDTRVEIVDIDSSSNERSFIAVKIQRSSDGNWVADDKFGNLDVQYTDLAAWHYTSK